MSTAYDARMYGYTSRAAFHKTIGWGDAGKIKVALMRSAFAGPNQDTHCNWDQIKADELDIDGAVTGYTTGGQVMTWAGGITDTYDNGATPGGQCIFHGDDIVWTGLDATFNVAVIYYSDGAGYSSPLIGYVRFTNGSNVVAHNQNFTIEFTDGIVFSTDLATT